MKEAKVSIILEISNSKTSLDRCLMSLDNQTFKDFEIIFKENKLNNDLKKIIDKYKNLPFNFEARNISAKYAIFINSRDWIREDMLEKMYNFIKKNNCDVVMCDFQRRAFANISICSLDNILKKRNLNNCFYLDELKGANLKDFNMCKYNKIYKADLIKNLVLKPESKTSKIGYISAPLYYFDIHRTVIIKNNPKKGQKPPKLSIITICYNEPKADLTCKSVVGQTMQDFEWIVIDGGSNKSTLDIFKKYQDRINVFVSEKDNGIYDAYNKALKLAKGEYISFLNAGDRYFDNSTLQKVFKTKRTKDILYGNTRNTNRTKWLKEFFLSPTNFFL